MYMYECDRGQSTVAVPEKKDKNRCMQQARSAFIDVVRYMLCLRGWVCGSLRGGTRYIPCSQLHAASRRRPHPSAKNRESVEATGMHLEILRS